MPRRGRPHGSRGRFTSIQHELPRPSKPNWSGEGMIGRAQRTAPHLDLGGTQELR
jgi:hypothetical protein